MLYDILICHLKNSWISSQVNSSTTSNIIMSFVNTVFFFLPDRETVQFSVAPLNVMKCNQT